MNKKNEEVLNLYNLISFMKWFNIIIFIFSIIFCFKNDFIFISFLMMITIISFFALCGFYFSTPQGIDFNSINGILWNTKEILGFCIGWIIFLH